MAVTTRPTPSPGSTSGHRALIVLLAVAMALRLAVVLVMPSHAWFDGGDGPWYVLQAWRIAHGALEGPLPTVGPLYPLLLAGAWAAFPAHPIPLTPEEVAAGYLTLVRCLQVILGVLTVAFTFRLALHLTADRRAALLAACGVGLGPAFVIEPFLLRTETLFMGLLTGVLAWHTRPQRSRPRAAAALTGALAACAAATRPVALLFPFVPAVHVLVRDGYRAGARTALIALATAVLVLAPWHLWLAHGTGRWLPEGFAFNLLTGASSHGGTITRTEFDTAQTQLQASGRSAAGEALHVIATDPAGWLLLRARNVARAMLQPHGTSDLGGPSMKAALADWWASGRSPATLLGLAVTLGFVVRLAIYGFHYVALALAVVGLVVTAPRWRAWLIVYGSIGYLVAVYALLVISPRYIFPIQPLLWVLAGAGGAALSRRWTSPIGSTGVRRSRSESDTSAATHRPA